MRWLRKHRQIIETVIARLLKPLAYNESEQAFSGKDGCL